MWSWATLKWAIKIKTILFISFVIFFFRIHNILFILFYSLNLLLYIYNYNLAQVKMFTVKSKLIKWEIFIFSQTITYIFIKKEIIINNSEYLFIITYYIIINHGFIANIYLYFYFSFTFSSIFSSTDILITIHRSLLHPH